MLGVVVLEFYDYCLVTDEEDLAWFSTENDYFFRLVKRQRIRIIYIIPSLDQSTTPRSESSSAKLNTNGNSHQNYIIIGIYTLKCRLASWKKMILRKLAKFLIFKSLSLSVSPIEHLEVKLGKTALPLCRCHAFVTIFPTTLIHLLSFYHSPNYIFLFLSAHSPPPPFN